MLCSVSFTNNTIEFANKSSTSFGFKRQSEDLFYQSQNHNKNVKRASVNEITKR
jgi:hypothetical protein